MPSLFEKTSIKSLSMPNRFIRSATWMSMAAADGSCTPRLVETTENLAAGGIGLIIAGFSFVSPEGKGPVGMTGMHSNHLVAGFRGLVDRVHGLGTPIAAQLAHCGIQSAPLSADGEVLGPSDIARDAGRTARGGGRLKARGLEAFEIDRIVEDFAAATVRAKEIGFDAVQLHFAHGYLGSQFLSPYYNQRDDEYGGSIENRIRFLLEVYRAARDAVGDRYPLMAKLNVEDFLEGGLTAEEGVWAATRLAEEGVDLLEISGGSGDSGRLGPARAIKTADDEGYFYRNAMAVKNAVQIPVAIVGGVRRFEHARRLVEEDGLDYVSMSRPLIREPNLVKRWGAGNLAPAECTSCSGCFRSMLKGRGIFCAQLEKGSG